MTEEFKEIGHSGGKITFSIRTRPEGDETYQVGFRSSRPVPMVMIGVYALEQGVVVATMNLPGLGDSPNPPPIPGCLPVYVASDSEGKFGHHCPRCDGYWRSGPWPNICPYCATEAPSHEFLSKAQQLYVRHYCRVLTTALQSGVDGDTVIDMDEVADAVDKEDANKPAFYVSEVSQQRKFTCVACEEFNDILGRFGYCSKCGTRCDLAEFEGGTMHSIREQLNGGAVAEDCVRDAVASFDSFTAQYAKQLAELVPMTKRRKSRLVGHSFHDMGEVRSIFRDWFDIDVGAGLKESEIQAMDRMFNRRHLYEHNGGEVDQKYLDKSADTTVRLKQHIHESREDAHSLLGSLVKMARNIHMGFEELIAPLPGPIKAFEEKKERIAKWSRERG